MTLLARPVVTAAGLRARGLRLPSTLSGVLALTAVTLTTALLVTLGVTRTSPVFFGDEIGYLANTIAIGGGPALRIDADSYYPGWSLVLVPLWWILRDPLALYRGAVILSALSSLATIPVLAALGRRLGLRTAHAVLAASVVVALPAHALMAGFALAESFLVLVVASAVLLAVIAARAETVRWYLAAGAASGFAFVVHGRVAGIVVAAVAWAILLLLQRRFRAGSALLASALIISALGYALYRHLEVVVYRSTGREADGVAKLFGSAPAATALGTSGQVWYLVVATAGLAIPGVVFVILRAASEIRSRRPGWALWFGVWALGLAAISITYVSRSVAQRDRLDLFVYGRYLEPATDLLAFFGMVLLVRLAPRALGAGRSAAPVRLRRRFVRLGIATVGAFAVVTAGFGLLAHAVVPTADETTSGWNPMNVLGIVQYGWQLGADDAALPLVQAALIGGGVLLAVLALGLLVRHRAVMLALALVFALGSSLVAQTRTVAPAYGGYASAFTLTHAVDRFGSASVSFVTAPDPLAPNRSSVISRNAYEFFLAPRVVPVVSGTAALPTTDLAIARKSWPAGVEAGWRRITWDPGYDNALWSRPGLDP
ncbi:phospholipid carrier-dependent glycosyltransferase [Frondihabitans peucedani]|uniref:ArnT-like N-terminal domain-containing protein n=1 Tax=Frondihabitans peucedani TaxID=598626 RepID=A0ABP8DY33_9MICO